MEPIWAVGTTVQILEDADEDKWLLYHIFEPSTTTTNDFRFEL